jgi:hypothetical protein
MDIHEAQSAWPWEMTAVRCPSPAKPPDAEQVVPPGQEAAHSARRQPLWSAVLCALQRFAVSSRTSQVGGVLGRQQTCSPSCSLLLALVAGHRGNGIHVVLVELGYLRRATGVPSAAGGSPPNPFPFVPFVLLSRSFLFSRQETPKQRNVTCYARGCCGQFSIRCSMFGVRCSMFVLFGCGQRPLYEIRGCPPFRWMRLLCPSKEAPHGQPRPTC